MRETQRGNYCVISLFGLSTATCESKGRESIESKRPGERKSESLKESEWMRKEAIVPEQLVWPPPSRPRLSPQSGAEKKEWREKKAEKQGLHSHREGEKTKDSRRPEAFAPREAGGHIHGTGVPGMERGMKSLSKVKLKI